MKSKQVSDAMYQLHRAKWIYRQLLPADLYTLRVLLDDAWERGQRQGLAMERRRWRRIHAN